MVVAYASTAETRLVLTLTLEEGIMDMSDILPEGLNVNDAWDLLSPVSIYILGMVIYSIFVFKFYRFVASRDVFALDLSKYEDVNLKWLRSTLHVVLYVIKYLVLFPVLAFFWFAVLTLVLAFLSKGQPFSETLSIALATVSTIRVTAYYRESLSAELAKILPFAVLAVFLIDTSFFSVSESIESLKEARDYADNILYYLLFLIGLEFVLRLLMGAIALIARSRDRGEGQSSAPQGRDDADGPYEPGPWDPAAVAPAPGPGAQPWLD